MEISFKISKPSGVPLIADFRQPDNSHRTTVDEAGDYKICFDNTLSRFSPKIVFFEIIIESPDGDNDVEEEDGFGDLFQGVPEIDKYDIQVRTNICTAICGLEELGEIIGIFTV